MKKRESVLWAFFERILKCMVFELLRIKVQEEAWKKFIQFVKFVLVGSSNVIISYGVYLIIFQLFQIWRILPDTDYLIAQFIGYVLSIFWSFYWNWKYVFVEDRNVLPWYMVLVKSFIAYSFTGVFLNSLLSFLWVEFVGVSKSIAPVINLVINVPTNFVMNKLWAFRDKKGELSNRRLS